MKLYRYIHFIFRQCQVFCSLFQSAIEIDSPKRFRMDPDSGFRINLIVNSSMSRIYCMQRWRRTRTCIFANLYSAVWCAKYCKAGTHLQRMRIRACLPPPRYLVFVIIHSFERGLQLHMPNREGVKTKTKHSVLSKGGRSNARNANTLE